MGCSIGSAAAKLPAQPEGRVVFRNKYSTYAKLGQGSYGVVYAARSNRTKRSVAIKEVSADTDDRLVSDRIMQNAGHELNVWRYVGKNSHVVQLHDWFCDDKSYLFVMEKCGANLMMSLEEINRYTTMDFSWLFREMLHGILHIHSLGLVHRDVKPDNFMFGGDDGSIVKLCDFGFSTMLPRDGSLLKGSCGTAPYMSPEMVSKSGHGMSTDMWSFGVSAYVLVYSTFPYVPSVRSSKAMKTAILNGTPRPRYEHPHNLNIHDALEAFIKSMLQREAFARATVRQALKSRLLTRSANSEDSDDVRMFDSHKGLAIGRVTSVGSTQAGTSMDCGTCVSHIDSNTMVSTARS